MKRNMNLESYFSVSKSKERGSPERESADSDLLNSRAFSKRDSNKKKKKTGSLENETLDRIDIFLTASKKKQSLKDERNTPCLADSLEKDNTQQIKDHDAMKSNSKLKEKEAAKKSHSHAPNKEGRGVKRQSPTDILDSSELSTKKINTPSDHPSKKVHNIDPSDVTVMPSNYTNYINRGGPLHKGEKDIPVGSPTCLGGYNFIVTGVLDTLEREEVIELIERCGGKVSKTLTKKVTHALIGREAGPSKMKLIEAKKIPIFDEDGLFDLIKQNSGSSKVESKRLMDVCEHLDDDQKNLEQLNSPKSSFSLWTEKYRPGVPSEIIGNQRSLQVLIDWLENWGKNCTQDTKKTFHKACLLTGPPGIGKTCSALVAVEKCGYRAYHLNASDQRSKTALKDRVESLLNTCGIFEFFGSKKSKTVLIMDEIDGMSSGDRGGLGEVSQMVKMSQVPIIALANDRYAVRTLAGSALVLHLPYHRPTVHQILSRVNFIASQENLDPSFCNRDFLQKLIESAHGDIRTVINQMQLLSKHSATSSDSLETMVKDSTKDIEFTPFDAASKLLNSNSENLNHNLDLFFVDYSLIPAFVHQNYLKSSFKTPSQMGQSGPDNFFLRHVLAANSISLGDILAKDIFIYQNWSLLPSYGTVSSLRPGFFVRGFSRQIEFPAILSKSSKVKKTQFLLEQLSKEMSMRTNNASSYAILFDYMPVLVKKLFHPLTEGGSTPIQSVIDFMDTYFISKEGRDTVLEIANYSKFPSQISDMLNSIPTATKTAFTRAYNSRIHNVISKKKFAKNEVSDDQLVEGETELESSEDEFLADVKVSTSKAKNLKSKKKLK